MKKNIDFEYALNKLKEITQRLEQGEENLEKSIKLYEEGMKLAKYCKDVLSESEQKITVIDINKAE